MKKIKRRLKTKLNAKYCECGCGAELTTQGNRFIWGHHAAGRKIPHSQKTKDKISKSRRGKLCGEENPSKRLEVREKISQKLKGRKMDSAWRKKLSISRKKHSGPNKGKPITKKIKAKLRKSNLGKKLTQKTKDKISLATKSHWLKPGYRENIILTHSGPLASNWQGGISCEPYCQIWLDKEYKESIKIRDGYKCQNIDCRKKEGRIFIVHHINYNKKNCHPWNLITLCNSCNGRANFNREYWEQLYQNILSKKYSYKYD